MRILLIIVLFSLLPIYSEAQRIVCTHYDIHDHVVKRIVQSGSTLETTYFDQQEQQIFEMCNPSTRAISSGTTDSLVRSLSSHLRKDTSQRERNIKFSFNVSSNGISNIRLLSFDVNAHNADEIESILKNVLDDLVISSDSSCQTAIEVHFIEYSFYPFYVEKKSGGYHVEEQNPKITRKKRLGKNR